MRTLTTPCELTEPQFVQNLAGLLLLEVVSYPRLTRREHAQRRRRQSGEIGQRLQARDQAVTTEQRHEPRQSRRREGGMLVKVRADAKSAEIAEARAVGARERWVGGLQRWRFGQPRFELGIPRPLLVLEIGSGRAARERDPGLGGVRGNRKVHRPLVTVRELQGEGEPVASDNGCR